MTKRVARRSPSPFNQPMGSRRSPFPHPPTTYPYPPRNRSAEIITISLLVAAFILLGLGGMLWFVQSRIALGPTPTPTATQGVPLTPTPDYLSTRVAEDFLTQQAYQMALLGTLTPTPLDIATPLPAEEEGLDATNTPVIMHLPGVVAPSTPTTTPTEPPPVALEPESTPTPNIVVLPIVVDSSLLATPTPAPVAELPTVEPTATETPTEVATETPTLEPPSPTPTATQPPPSPTPTTAIAVPTFVVASLQGVIEGRNASLRLGPSSVYTEVAQLGPQSNVTILGRTPGGEWLYVCCVNNQPLWARHAFVRPRNNARQPNAPEDSDPNDVRWLKVELPPPNLPPMPPPVAAGPDDYALPRYDRHASGRVDALPSPPLNPTWAQEARAGAGLISPVMVVGSNVLVGSADNHLYSFERQTGSQRWRRDFCQDGCRTITLAPMIYDNEIFVVDQNRAVSAFSDPNNLNLIWRITIDQPALTSFNVFSETLYLAMGNGGNDTLLALDRDNGAVRWRQETEGPRPLRYPAIGDQLIYAADGTVTAYDVINGELIWRNTNAQEIIAGPVYGSPGPDALAELYVVAANNRIYALDANTGVELWNIDNGQPATSLALNESTLFVAGDGYIKAISRADRGQRWNASIAGGPVIGGPLVDANRVLAVTQAGTVHLLEASSGSAITIPSIGSAAGGAPAVSGSYLFVPGSDGRLYAYLGNQ